MRKQIIAQRLDYNAADIWAALARAKAKGIDLRNVYVTDLAGNPIQSVVMFESTLPDGSKTYDIQIRT